MFLPYADARTSVLFIDKEHSRSSDKVLFINMQHFGVALTTRARKISQNDIPNALRVIREYKKTKSIDSNIEPGFAFEVAKNTILSEKDVDLSQELYREYQLPPDKASIFSELGEIITEEKSKAKNGSWPVWSVSNRLGFVPSEEYFGNQVASEDISSYKLVPPGCFAYNPARINVGSIALNDTSKTGAVSPMYVVFKINDTRLQPSSLLAFLKSPQALYHIKRLSHGTVRQQLRFKDLKRLLVITDSKDFNELVETQNILIADAEKQIATCKNTINDKIASIWGNI